MKQLMFEPSCEEVPRSVQQQMCGVWGLGVCSHCGGKRDRWHRSPGSSGDWARGLRRNLIEFQLQDIFTAPDSVYVCVCDLFESPRVRSVLLTVLVNHSECDLKQR